MHKVNNRRIQGGEKGGEKEQEVCLYILLNYSVDLKLL